MSNETDYLLSTPANADHLERSMAQLRAGQTEIRELLEEAAANEAPDSQEVGRKEIDGKWFSRDKVGDPWAPCNHPIDDLVEKVRVMMGYKTKKQTCDMIWLDGGVISRIKSGHARLTERIMVRIYDVTEGSLTLPKIREIAGIPATTDLEYEDWVDANREKRVKKESK